VYRNDVPKASSTSKGHCWKNCHKYIMSTILLLLLLIIIIIVIINVTTRGVIERWCDCPGRQSPMGRQNESFILVQGQTAQNTGASSQAYALLNTQHKGIHLSSSYTLTPCWRRGSENVERSSLTRTSYMVYIVKHNYILGGMFYE